MVGHLYGSKLYIETVVRSAPERRDHNKDMLALLSMLRPLITPAK
jgi:hypothetical protein